MPDPVSRETPPVPTAAAGVFASRLPVAEAYVDMLATAGIDRGLLGPREVPRLWERHVLNCAAVSELLPTDCTIADLGSGAGLPGIVVAICRPDVTMTLVEPLARRTTFLEDTVRELSLDNVTVRRARAEELHGTERFDVVTSRALAPLPRLLEWSLPLLGPDGEVLAIKGRNAAAEVDDLALPDAARRHIRVAEVGVADLDVPTTVVRVDSTLGRHLRWGSSSGTPRKASPRSARRRRP